MHPRQYMLQVLTPPECFIPPYLPPNPPKEPAKVYRPTRSNPRGMTPSAPFQLMSKFGLQPTYLSLQPV